MSKSKIIKVGTNKGDWHFDASETIQTPNEWGGSNNSQIIGGYTLNELWLVHDFYHRGISDFKSSLRKEIEERIKAFKELNSMLKDIHGFDDNATCKLIQELKTVLTLLDTCVPTVKEE